MDLGLPGCEPHGSYLTLVEAEDAATAWNALHGVTGDRIAEILSNPISGDAGLILTAVPCTAIRLDLP